MPFLKTLANEIHRLPVTIEPVLDFFWSRNIIFSNFFLDEKVDKKSRQFFSVTFFLIKKSPKNQADGKCSHTDPYAPTVGMAPARIIMAN